jgi:hypothetical protein
MNIYLEDDTILAHESIIQERNVIYDSQLLVMQIYNSNFKNDTYNWQNWDSSVSIVTRLWTGQSDD